MSISSFNPQFKSTKYIFAKVKRFLSSYNNANIINEGEFPTYVKEVLNFLGVGLFKENKALIRITDGKGTLPENFRYLYAAYNCKSSKERKHLQSNVSFETDVTSTLYSDTSSSCQISCYEKGKNFIESVNIKTYVNEKDYYYNFEDFQPLRLSPNVSKNCFSEDCMNINFASKHEISIENKHIYVNYDNGYVFMKYYGFPINDDGDIEIPDIEKLEKCIEWYIIYQILLASWFNSSVPDIQNKFIKAEQEYEKYYAEVKYFLKTPSFTEMINMIRNKKSNNMLVFMTKNHGDNYQRTN